MRIGLDIMGGDFAPQASKCGALLAVDVLDTSCRPFLIGDKPSKSEALGIVQARLIEKIKAILQHD
jgi:fatty acid/phospholipid biosynthesis enzyme